MAPNPLSGLAIVVVEDHDDSRRYLCLFLSRLGASVAAARNAVEGLHRAVPCGDPRNRLGLSDSVY